MTDIDIAVSDLIECVKSHGLTLAFAESLTGGLISASVVAVPGVSEFFNGAIVSYSNEVKINTLKVPSDVISSVGAVSAECAEYMARGVAKELNSDVGVSATGIAGPDGGSDLKPVGTVYIGAYCKGNTKTERFVFEGDRLKIREQTVIEALKLAKDIIVNG
ncbi:MAG: CinA family protein [Clostridiales bacterium]|nr:CinA family protein [Clostridiales bacterium]